MAAPGIINNAWEAKYGGPAPNFVHAALTNSSVTPQEAESRIASGEFGGQADVSAGDAGLGKILDFFKQRQDERNKIVSDFQSKNPFVYDDVLAQKTAQAKEQLDPYYNQTLSDYLQGVTRQKERSVADEQRLLGELSTDLTQYRQRAEGNLQVSMEQAREQASQSGLLNSGKADRAQGLLQRENNLNLQDYLQGNQRRADTITTQTNRTLEDLLREQSLKTRDIETERTSQINTLAPQLVQEEAQKRAYALNQALGPLADNNNNYDVLGGLGIG